MVAASLRAGTITDSVGRLDTGLEPRIRRILSYNFVRRIFFLLGLSVALTGCYSGSRPPRINSEAPDFIVQDSDRKVELRAYRGKFVVLNFWATWCPPWTAAR